MSPYRKIHICPTATVTAIIKNFLLKWKYQCWSFWLLHQVPHLFISTHPPDLNKHSAKSTTWTLVPSVFRLELGSECLSRSTNKYFPKMVMLETGCWCNSVMNQLYGWHWRVASENKVSRVWSCLQTRLLYSTAAAPKPQGTFLKSTKVNKMEGGLDPESRSHN